MVDRYAHRSSLINTDDHMLLYVIVGASTRSDGRPALDESDERLLTVKQIVERLQVSSQTVQLWLRTGQLPGYQLGRKAGWRVRQSDLDAFLEERYRPRGKVAA